MQRDLYGGDPTTLRAFIYDAPSEGDPPATRPRAMFNTFKWLFSSTLAQRREAEAADPKAGIALRRPPFGHGSRLLLDVLHAF